jgi:hypothetical protein
MFKLERLRASIYIVFIVSMVPMRSDGVELYAIEAEEIQLPSKYVDYTDVFLEEEAMKFPESTRVEHAIPIEEDAEVSYELIYSLFMNEL